jgi:hypothetical protein
MMKLLGSLALMLFFIYWIRQKYIWQTNDPAVVVGLCVTMVFGLHSLTDPVVVRAQPVSI